MTFNLEPGMRVKPRSEGKQVNVNVKDNDVNISISARNEKELEYLMNSAAHAVAKKLGYSEPKVIEAIRADILSTHTRSDTIVPAPSIKGDLQFGLGQSQQSMAKAALVLWARLVGSEEITRPSYDQIRNFIWNGDKPNDPTVLVKLDYRNILETPPEFGTNPNIIQVISDKNGAVYGYFRLYGAIGWRFLLSSSGAPPRRACSLISNPFQNEVFSLDKDEKAILPAEWILADWSLDLDNMNPAMDRLGFLIAHGQDLSQRLMIEDWFKEACAQCGCKEGEVFTEEHLKFISEYVSKRAVVHLTRRSVSWSSARS
ncbi:hypothetical protein [Roseixanthobacter glucoisosaccharinicivorans]|uniref:hypothetical protein n=1 Tax=Roseixanthobacter glucoisosaccharinicivorans TaxID=3119923 RepID=UPI00372AF30D